MGGNVNFWGAVIRNGKDQAINADNAKIDGSFSFGGGFLAEGEVSLYGAEISKDLDFSGSTFDNQEPAGIAINANGSSVSGNVFFQPTEPTEDYSWRYPFQSFGIVSLWGANCGAMYCSGGAFSNRNSMDKPDSPALNCSFMSVNGQVVLSHLGPRRFEARGLVRFYAAHIGGNFEC